MQFNTWDHENNTLFKPNKVQLSSWKRNIYDQILKYSQGLDEHCKGLSLLCLFLSVFVYVINVESQPGRISPTGGWERETKSYQLISLINAFFFFIYYGVYHGQEMRYLH